MLNAHENMLILTAQFSHAFLLILLSSFGENKYTDKIENKLNDLKIKYQKKADVAFGDRIGLEYPGDDEKLLVKIRKQWDEYYACLNQQNLNLGLHRTVTPEAIMIFEGKSVRLDCKMCLSPANAGDEDTVTWLHDSLPPAGAQPVEYGEHVLMSPEDKSLLMYNLKREDAGQYLCQVGNTVTGPYFLEVADTKEPVLEVKPLTAPKALHSQPDVIVQGRFKVSTSWEPWSPCNKCDKVGKRVRFGMCTVILHANEKLRESTVGISETESVLHLFKKGIPCRSILLPEEFRKMMEIGERPSELMAGFCKVPCPRSTVFEVLDANGNVIETANNTAGIYSTLQGIPPVPPPVERRTMFEGTDKFKIVLKCPGSLNKDTPVLWQIGSFNVNPQLIRNESRGRIYLDMKEHLNIKRPRLADSNIYSCWQGSELAGTIRLVVFKKVRLSFNHHIMLFGMVLIMGSFLLVFYRAFKGRKRQLAR